MNLPEHVDISTDSIPQYQEFPGLRNFACRAALVGGMVSGEYHIKPLIHINISVLISIMNGVIENATFAVIDPEGILNLEWPIIMKISSILGNEVIEDSLRDIDRFLERK